METLILNKEETQGIDWSKPQWLVDVKQNKIVFTNGIHSCDCFEGTCLPCETYPEGETSAEWGKRFFKPIPENGLTIKITND